VKKILVFDTYNMLHIARFGIPDDGNNQIAYNFINKYKYIRNKFSADEVYFVVDGYPKHRYALDPNYKANRKKKNLTEEEIAYWENFGEQKKLILSILKTGLPCKFIHHPDVEGDDMVYYIVKDILKKENCEVTIISSDTDYIQMLNELKNVKLWTPVKQHYRNATEYSYLSWKSMVGDSSDNIKGVRGIGKVRAEKILKNGSLQSMIDNDSNFRGQYLHAYNMIRLRDDLPEQENFDIVDENLTKDELYSLVESLGFNSFLGKNWESVSMELGYE
tara:strand:+ start:161 stop:988 length:828 start_codon:yes stop_codon:yes gene_type:complete